MLWGLFINTRFIPTFLGLHFLTSKDIISVWLNVVLTALSVLHVLALAIVIGIWQTTRVFLTLVSAPYDHALNCWMLN